MHAHIEQSWASDSVKVWLYDDNRSSVMLIRPAPQGPGSLDLGGWSTYECARGELPAPSFEIPLPALKALVEAASDVVPPDRAMADHLADAREVRDRLLALVEHVIQPLTG